MVKPATLQPVMTLLASALLLAGCAVGPDYQAPLASMPAQTAFVNSSTDSFTTAAPATRWWQLYQNAELDAAIVEALDANTDLRSAEANLRRADAVLLQSRRAQLPTTTVSSDVTRSRQNFFLDEPIAVQNTVYRAGLSASYQVDLFGRVRRSIEASRANAEAVEAMLHVTQITIAAETASAYADACAAGFQLEVAQNNLGLQNRTLELTTQLRDAGRGTSLDTASAATAAAQSRAMIPGIQAQRDAALYRLAVLMGRPPAEFPPSAAACNRPLTLTQAIPVGDGAALLQRRPDLRQAERELAAATARVGIVAADLYPTVSIGASAGSAALSANTLGDSNTSVWSIGPLLSWSFPNVTATRARQDQAEADVDAARARFDGAWLNALRETETALSAYAHELDRIAALEEARTSSSEAAMLANARFDAGQQNFLDVLQSELTLTNAELALAESEARLATLQIGLFLALGGGWSE